METSNSAQKSALLKNYSRYDIDFDYGQGAYLYDKSGKEYLDFLGGIAVAGFGYNNSDIRSAVDAQLDKFWHVSNLFVSELQENLALKLAGKSGLDYAFFSNSGTEANEAAIKFARIWGNSTGRNKIISTKGSFHGRSMGSLSATGQEKLWKGFEPMTPGFVFAEYGNLLSLENAYTDDVCAVILEPIQGESGIVVPADSYLQAVRDFCSEKNILMIVDEVQSGMGRTGKFFAFQWAEIKPDIITLAKSIANGFPLGATLCTSAVADFLVPGTHGSTFGGNPVAVAAANKVIDMITDDVLSANEKNGNNLKASIERISSSKIKEIRGKGLMLGIELAEGYNAKNLAKKMIEKGVLVGTSGDNVIRLLPSYVINGKEIAKFVEIFANVLDSDFMQ